MKAASYLIMAGLITAVCAVSGCTVVGLTIGAAIDSKNNGVVALPIEKLYALKPDDEITIKLQNGLVDEGVFVRIDTMRIEEYELSYTTARKLTKDCYLPALHERVEVALDSLGGNCRVNGEFFGFDERSVRLLKDSSCCPISYFFKNVSSITGKGKQKLSNPQLSKLFEDRRLPWCTFVALRTMYGIKAIPMDEISCIQVRVPEDDKSNWMRTMSFGGAVIDVVLIMAVFKVDVSSFFFPDK